MASLSAMLVRSCLAVFVTALAALAQAPVTFASIFHAERNTWAEVLQRRSVLESDGHGGMHWAAIDETLRLGADRASGQARFVLELVGVPGMVLDPAEFERRRDLHASRAGFLQQFGSFHVGDVALAEQNYQIIPLDQRSRLGRPTQRVAVVSRQLGRSAWILEVDAATHYPLYRAEVSSLGVIVSTLEVLRMTPTDPAPVGAVSWWRPTSPVEYFGDVNAAVSALGVAEQSVLPIAQELPQGFRFLEARTVIDTLRPESNLVLLYTDGVESMFVVETFGAPLPSVPVMSPTDTQSPYALFVYQDVNTLQLMFHNGTVQTIVIGASGEFGVVSLAQDLLARSLGR
ncbi:MAG: hypothetical protein U1F36_18015 [Planctomycetota bacterium]